jgi:putative tryptophan/tyrosine transport system substrate-binding protein
LSFVAPSATLGGMKRKSHSRRTTRRRFVGQLALVAGIAPSLSHAAAHPDRMPRIGYLGGDFPVHRNAFMGELRARGFIDGENLLIERRLVNDLSEGPAMAKELAHLPLQFIVATALPFALMIRKENPNMPMVITTCPGMVSNGFATSLEHPGGNYTGLDELPPGVTAKRLTLLKTAVPAVKRVALLSTTPGVGGHETQLADAQRIAPTLGVTVEVYRATTAKELDDALEKIVSDRMDGVLNFQGGLSVYRRQLIVDFINSHRVPAIYQATLFAEAGGLMSWAPDLVEQQREAARLSAQILKGAKPGDLPVKHPTGYCLTVNAGAARKTGINLPPELLAQAKRVIE